MKLDAIAKRGFNRENIVDTSPGSWSIKTTREKVGFVAKVIFSVVLSTICFWMNPAIFFLSFVVGVAFNKKVTNGVNKIKKIIANHKWPVVLGCSVACFLALPVFLATFTTTWSLFCGSYLSTKAQKSIKK